jgi:DnaJ-class molecular chaperone
VTTGFGDEPTEKPICSIKQLFSCNSSCDSNMSSFGKTAPASPKEDWSKKTLYQVLNVDKSATKEEIRRAFRRIAIQVHPDKQASSKQAMDVNVATERFRLVKTAYTVLSNDSSRSLYDATGLIHEGTGLFHDEDGVHPNQGFDWQNWEEEEVAQESFFPPGFTTRSHLPRKDSMFEQERPIVDESTKTGEEFTKSGNTKKERKERLLDPFKPLSRPPFAKNPKL